MITKLLVGVCSLLFFMIGADKFIGFLEPPCSLMGSISNSVWIFLGVLQLAAGVLIWLPRYRKYVAGFFAVFMLVFSIVHLVSNTTDVGGSLFMFVLLAILVWNPAFIRSKENLSVS